MQTLLNIGIDGIAYGMVLFVIAVGLSVTLGLMRFVNLSHGAFAMIGGYAAALLTREAHWNFWLALPVAVLGTALIGALLEALVLRHLYKRSELEQVPIVNSTCSSAASWSRCCSRSASRFS